MELTDQSTFNDRRGALLVVDENRTNINFPALVLADERLVHYAIISNGPDGKGAFNRDGEVAENCIMVLPPTPPPPPPPPGGAPINQTENCDVASTAELDGAVLNAILNTRDDRYYDDSIYLEEFASTELWKTLDYPDYDKIVPVSTGNVGIGVSAPTEKLHVKDGNLRADGLKAGHYCDSSGANCMEANSIGGFDADMQCPPGQVAVGISENAINCAVPTIVQLNTTCPVGQFLRGVRIASGTTTALCQTP